MAKEQTGERTPDSMRECCAGAATGATCNCGECDCGGCDCGGDTEAKFQRPARTAASRCC
jgi:hypothetical protein